MAVGELAALSRKSALDGEIEIFYEANLYMAERL